MDTCNGPLRQTEQARQVREARQMRQARQPNKQDSTSKTARQVRQARQARFLFYKSCKKISFQVLGGVHTQLNKLTENKLECCKEDELSLILLWKLDTLHSSSTVKSHR